MHALARLLLIYAAALCLTLAAFALMPILGLAGEAPSRAVVPWLLVVGGLLGALDCWRLSRRLQARMEAHTRDRWLPQRVELFARGRGSFAAILGCLTFAAVVLFAATFGTPNTATRPTGRLPALEFKVQPGPNGESRLTLGDDDLAKLRQYWTIPAKRKLDPWTAAKVLAILGLFGLTSAISYLQYRRDGRASLSLDASGIEHAWIGRVPWERVQALTVTPMHGYASDVLVLLVDNPAPLLARLPREEALRQKWFPAVGESPGEIVLSLDAFDADARRLHSVARRLRGGVSPPPLEGWSFGMADSSVQALLRARDADAGALALPRRRDAPVAGPRPAPAGTPELALTLGDRLSVAWVGLVSLVSAAQLFAMTLFGQGLWLQP